MPAVCKTAAQDRPASALHLATSTAFLTQSAGGSINRPLWQPVDGSLRQGWHRAGKCCHDPLGRTQMWRDQSLACKRLSSLAPARHAAMPSHAWAHLLTRSMINNQKPASAGAAAQSCAQGGKNDGPRMVPAPLGRQQDSLVHELLGAQPHSIPLLLRPRQAATWPSLLISLSTLTPPGQVCCPILPTQPGPRGAGAPQAALLGR